MDKLLKDDLKMILFPDHNGSSHYPNCTADEEDLDGNLVFVVKNLPDLILPSSDVTIDQWRDWEPETWRPADTDRWLGVLLLLSTSQHQYLHSPGRAGTSGHTGLVHGAGEVEQVGFTGALTGHAPSRQEAVLPPS